MEDREIVDLYWERKQEATVRTQEKYGAYCMKVAANLLESREDAEECVNDTWLHAWNVIPPHRPQVLRMFLAKITRRLAINRYRANTAAKRGGGENDAILSELEECVADGKGVEDEVLAKELSECVRKFVRELPEREGDLFVRRYFFAESIETVARGYGISVNNATVILSRARKKLRQYLEKEGLLT